jgi:hypothetical protein
VTGSNDPGQTARRTGPPCDGSDGWPSDYEWAA